MPNASHLLSFAALATGLRADVSLDAVLRAQELIQSHTWTEVVRIENLGPASRYPRTVSALIFQMDSVLWFYTPFDGTQSLSLVRGRAEADKNNLVPLLREIDPGFTKLEVLPRAKGPLGAAPRPPNACFIESMAILFQGLARGERMENPKLLSYYVALPGGIRGHTVLQFTSGGRLLVVDPDRPGRERRIRHADENDAGSVAGRIRGDVAKARHLPLGEFLYRSPGRFYATVSGNVLGHYETANPAKPETHERTGS
ncbi:MAG TPA: hypothetical protein VGG37_02060 [Opitutaceae bacterium]